MNFLYQFGFGVYANSPAYVTLYHTESPSWGDASTRAMLRAALVVDVLVVNIILVIRI